MSKIKYYYELNISIDATTKEKSIKTCVKFMCVKRSHCNTRYFNLAMWAPHLKKNHLFMTHRSRWQRLGRSGSSRCPAGRTSGCRAAASRRWPWRATDAAEAVPPSPWSAPAACDSRRCRRSRPRSVLPPPPTNYWTVCLIKFLIKNTNAIKLKIIKDK